MYHLASWVPIGHSEVDMRNTKVQMVSPKEAFDKAANQLGVKAWRVKPCTQPESGFFGQSPTYLATKNW
jgi:hypothetical protein